MRGEPVPDAVRLRIYLAEGDRYRQHALYEELLKRFHQAGLAGATVLQAIAGFGSGNTLHTAKVLRLSGNLPIVIELIDTAPRIDEARQIVDGLLDSGMMTTEPITAVRY